MKLQNLVFITAMLLVIISSLPNPCVQQCPAGTKCFLSQCVPAEYLPVSCSQNADCSAGEICNNYFCELAPQKLCVPSCKSGETCKNGICTPQTCKMLCLKGFHCQNGKCVPDNPADKCAVVRCPTGSTCRNGICYPNPIKLCNKLCIIGTHCENGQCVPDTPVDKCAAVTCLTGSTCINGICIPSPVKVCKKFCIKGTHCVNGECVPIEKTCDTSLDCNVQQQCIKGVCQNTCKTVLCPFGKTCFDGKCQPTKCGRIDCPSGTSCKNGQCVPNIYVCPSNAKYETKVCTDPRPTEKTCPTIYYFRAPDPLFCGVKADGTRINFSQQCTTCKDKSIVYYFTKPCHQVPFVCQPGDICKGYYCSSPCTNSEDCPYDWQTCGMGRCIDRCDVIRCARGPCKFGQCAYEEASGSCTFGIPSGCTNDAWSCVGSQCADLCVRQACPPNQTCKLGGCFPNA